MAALFSRLGVASLKRLAAERSVLVFDLDGTLAPLVSQPADAVVPRATAERLDSLSRAWPVAVITGREVADARPRLGFEPGYLFGNHGAERSGADVERLSRDLEPCRAVLRRHRSALHEHGIDVEDKRLSLGLHYRLVVDLPPVLQWLDALIASLRPGIRACHGHHVLDITPAVAPDKGDALLEIMHDCGASTALVIGDDTNDEPAFFKAPPDAVSVRIGPVATPTRARFRLPRQSEVDDVLSMLLSLRRCPNTPHRSSDSLALRD